MPVPDTDNPVQTVDQASVTVVDYRGNKIATSLRSNGAPITTGQASTLATAIANASNGCPAKWSIGHSVEVSDADLRFYDEAEASDENVIVIVLQHDTNSALDQEVLIPAYDASLLLPDMRTPDTANAQLLAVAVNALEVVNEDGNDPVVPVYHTWRAFTSVRRLKSARVRAHNLPAPIEPPLLALPPDAPGA